MRARRATDDAIRDGGRTIINTRGIRCEQDGQQVTQLETAKKRARRTAVGAPLGLLYLTVLRPSGKPNAVRIREVYTPSEVRMAFMRRTPADEDCSFKILK